MLNLYELYVMLGIKPNANVKNYEIIIKNKETNNIENVVGMDQLFEWISFNIPLVLLNS